MGGDIAGPTRNGRPGPASTPVERGRWRLLLPASRPLRDGMGEPESESAGTHGQQGASMPVARGHDRIADRRDNAAEERDRIADAREHRPTTGSGTSTPGRSCWPNAGRNARHQRSHRGQPRIHRARPGSPAPVRGATGPNRGSPSTPASKSPAASRTRSTAKPPTADTNRNSNSRPHRVARNRGRPRCRQRRRPPLRTHRQRDSVWTVRRLVPSCRSLVRWTRSRRVATSFASPRAGIWLR